MKYSEKGSKMLSAGHDTTIEIMSSQHLRLLALSQHNLTMPVIDGMGS